MTHRILSKTEEGNQTKGDAKTDPDSGTIPAENIRGTYLFCIPYLGYGFMWAKNHMFLTVGFLALFMLLFFCFPLSPFLLFVATSSGQRRHPLKMGIKNAPAHENHVLMHESPYSFFSCQSLTRAIERFFCPTCCPFCFPSFASIT